MKTCIIALALLLCAFAPPAAAQSTDDIYSRNAVYLELGGQGIFYTVNYEHRFAKFFACRAGFTHFTLTDFFFSDLTITAFPLMAVFLMGGTDHFFEIGAGVIPTIAESGFRWIPASSTMGIVGTAHLGYRYQPADGGFMFRASVPVFVTENGAGAWGGVSFGYAF